MKVFVTGVGGQLGHDVMNELEKRGYEGIGSELKISLWPVRHWTARSSTCPRTMFSTVWGKNPGSRTARITNL